MESFTGQGKKDPEKRGSRAVGEKVVVLDEDEVTAGPLVTVTSSALGVGPELHTGGRCCIMKEGRAERYKGGFSMENTLTPVS